MYKLLYLIILFSIALLPKINIINVSSRGTGIRLEDFVVLIFVLLEIYQIFFRKKNVYKDKRIIKLSKLFFVYIFVCIISTVYGCLKEYISFKLGILYLFRKIEYFVLLFVGYKFIKCDKSRMGKLQKFLDIVVVIHFIVCILQSLGIVGSFINGRYASFMTQGRASSTFNGAYEMSAFLLIILPIYMYNIVYKKEIKLKNILPILLILLCILISKSRSSLIVLLFELVLFIFFLNKGKGKKIRNFIFISILAIFMLFLVLEFGLENLGRFATISIDDMIDATVTAWNGKNFDHYVNTNNWFGNNSKKIHVILSDGDASYNLRVNHWMQLIDGFLRSPIIGVGLSISGSAADGNYIRILCESGILGMSLWFMILFFIFKSTLKKDKFLTASRVSLYSMMLGAIFIDIFEASKIMMMFWFMLGAAYAYGDENDKENLKLEENKIEN